MLASHAARFNAAEGKLIITVVKRIHPHVAGLELVDRLVSVEQIAGPDGRTEAKLRGIGLLDGFVNSLKGVNR